MGHVDFNRSALTLSNVAFTIYVNDFAPVAAAFIPGFGLALQLQCA